MELAGYPAVIQCELLAPNGHYLPDIRLRHTVEFWIRPNPFTDTINRNTARGGNKSYKIKEKIKRKHMGTGGWGEELQHTETQTSETENRTAS